MYEESTVTNDWIDLENLVGNLTIDLEKWTNEKIVVIELFSSEVEKSKQARGASLTYVVFDEAVLAF